MEGGGIRSPVSPPGRAGPVRHANGRSVWLHASGKNRLPLLGELLGSIRNYDSV